MKPAPFGRWPRRDELFDRALDLEGGAREQFLAEECEDDAELRDELQRLLAAMDTSGDLLDAPLSWDRVGGDDEVATGTPAWTGRSVGHYEVRELLGLGGMGAVYRAQDTRLNRPVALKFLRPHLGADPAARARFVQEAQAASALDHANICTIYEIGETDDGQVFIAMALASGETLRARLARGPIETEEAVRIARQIGAGLQRAHEAGIVHRDLKPANVMLTDRGEVKILDFGIAKLEGTTDLTRAGARIGTVAYMSPEQASGESVDRRTDVWAFGAVLYEMLLGDRAFRADNEQAVIHQILNVDPPSLDALHDVAPGLDQVVRRCLHRDPGARYPDLSAVLADLADDDSLPITAEAAPSPVRRWRTPAVWLGAVGLAAGAFGAARLWIPGQTVPFEARDWLLVADIGNQTGDSLLDYTLDGVLTGGIAASKHVNVLPRRRIQAALQRMQRPLTDPVQGEVALEVAQRWGVPVALLTTITRVDQAYRLTARLVAPETGIDLDVVTATADRREAILPALDGVIADVRRRLGETRFAMLGTTAPLPVATTASLQALKAFATGTRSWTAGQWHQAADAWLEAVALDSTFARAHSNLGDYYYQFNDRIKGEEHFALALANLDRVDRSERLWIQSTIEGRRGNQEAALRIMETLVREYPDYEAAWYNLGSGYMRMRVCDRAAAAMDQVLRIDSTVAGAHIQVATCYSATGEYEAAIERYERALAVDSSYLRWANVAHEYGTTLLKAGQVERAEALFVRMAASNFPRDRASGLRSLALYDLYRGRFARAVAALEQSSSVFAVVGSPLSRLRNHLYAAVAFNAVGASDAALQQLDVAASIADSISMEPYWLALMGRLYVLGGRPERARRALDAMAPVFNDQDPSDHAMRDVLQGELAIGEGDLQTAVRLFERAKANRDDGLTSALLARAYQVAGDRDRAIDEYESAIARSDLGWEAQQPWVLAHYELGQLYEARGEFAKAVEYYGRFVSIWNDADPEAIPSVAEVRERIETLRAEHAIG